MSMSSGLEIIRKSFIERRKEELKAKGVDEGSATWNIAIKEAEEKAYHMVTSTHEVLTIVYSPTGPGIKVYDPISQTITQKDMEKMEPYVKGICSVLNDILDRDINQSIRENDSFRELYNKVETAIKGGYHG